MQDSRKEMSNMDTVGEAGSRRIFCDPEPDYTRRRLEIPEEVRERMLGRLRFLYGEAVADEYLPELERIMRVHHAHRKPEMVKRDQDFDPNERFTERDLVLITYGDLLTADDLSPLATLSHFLERPKMRGIFNTIHILPFFPYSSDRGFSVKSFKQVDPRLGSWDDITEIGKDYQLMFDGVLNHASAQTWQFREVLNGHPWWKNMVITYSSPDELTPEQRKMIRRPRTSDVLTKSCARRKNVSSSLLWSLPLPYDSHLGSSFTASSRATAGLPAGISSSTFTMRTVSAGAAAGSETGAL
jgi:hypothetical protein